MTTKVQAPAVASSKTIGGDAVRSGVAPWMALAAGWLVPGAGHLLLGKWVRAALLEEGAPPDPRRARSPFDGDEARGRSRR